jgi:type VI secretion system secreted protein VgrG
MAVETPLGPDALLLETLTGTEEISGLFHFELGLLAPAGTDIDFANLLGQVATVRLPVPASGTRFVSGVVSRFVQGGEVRGPDGDATFTRCRAELVPRLWLLGLSARSRTFQKKSVPDILKDVLAGLDVSFQFQARYEPRDYCAQYRETDLAFASRLMEEEGIFYYFTFAAGKHTLVVADSAAGHLPAPVAPGLIFETVLGGTRPEDRVFAWEKSQELRTGRVTLWDHCFEMPDKNLESVAVLQGTVQAGTAQHKLKLDPTAGLEVYEHPGRYAQRFDGVDTGGGDRSGDLSKIFPDGTRTAKVRGQQEATGAVRATGESTCRQLTAGHTVTLERHPHAAGKYVVTRVRHTATLEGAYTNRANDAIGYANAFECAPVDLPFRPALRTPRPVVHGTQTAVVVGPPGEEIATDKYGRVKVQFHWDREGKNNLDSSCWVRVATGWAGKQWGAIHIPRVGQEVVVAFEEGDADRPIVVGSVYNAALMPPYPLPDNKTRSTLKSRSTLNGEKNNFNEIRFEDKKGQEEIYVHAEKDFNRVVENNDTLKVGFEKKDGRDQKTGQGDRTVEVFNNLTEVVGFGKGQTADGSHTVTVYKNRTATINTGNETLTVEQGNRTVTVAQGSDTHQVQRDRTVTVEAGNDSLTIKAGNQTTTVSLGASTTEAMHKIELKVGESSVVITPAGVTIKGMLVTIQGQMQAVVKGGAATQVTADGILTLKGALTTIG